MTCRTTPSQLARAHRARRRHIVAADRRAGMTIPAAASLALAALASALLAGCALPRTIKSPETRMREDLEARRAEWKKPEAPVAEKGSLWTENGAVSLAGDTHAYRAGDLLTVDIVEDTRGSQQAATDLNKDAQLSLKAPILAGYESRLTKKFPALDPANILSTSTSKAFKGDGSTSRQTSIVATLTARVLGVYPNGDMAILGHKDVEVNHERQVLTIAGIVRPADLGADNTISSERIAELGLHLGGRGDINDAQREGWLSRLIQKVWPF